MLCTSIEQFMHDSSLGIHSFSGLHELILISYSQGFICFLVYIIFIVLKKLNFLVTVRITPLVFYTLLHVLCFVGYECIYRGSTGFGYIC